MRKKPKAQNKVVKTTLPRLTAPKYTTSGKCPITAVSTAPSSGTETFIRMVGTASRRMVRLASVPRKMLVTELALPREEVLHAEPVPSPVGSRRSQGARISRWGKADRLQEASACFKTVHPCAAVMAKPVNGPVSRGAAH